jgi:hypothetical protein
MERSEIISLAEALVEDYKDVLHIDPYFKVLVELSDFEKISECFETDSPATWILRLNPSNHEDGVDIQMSVVNGMLAILFRDIPQSKRRDEVISKLTHAITELTVQATSDEPEAPSEDLM